MAPSARPEPRFPPGPQRELVELLKLLQKSSRLNGTQIARRAGYQPSYISEILHGHRSPSPDAAVRIVEAMGGDKTAAMRALRYAEEIKEWKAEQKTIRAAPVPEVRGQEKPQDLAVPVTGGGAKVVQSAQYSILALGIDGLPGHQPPAQREIMHGLVRSAAADCALALDGWQSADLDGRLIVQVPSWVPPAQLAGPFMNALDSGLARQHQESGPGTMRLRVALHAGPVFLGGHQLASPAIELARQLADAPQLHQTLAAAPRARLAVITSDSIFQDVIRHAHRLIDTAAYLPVLLGGSGEVGWVTVPGYAAPPGVSGAATQPRPRAASPAPDGGGQAGPVVHVGTVNGGFVNNQVVYGGLVHNHMAGGKVNKPAEPEGENS
jgi:transcriptional regulator with XRE-family HTH domain